MGISSLVNDDAHRSIDCTSEILSVCDRLNSSFAITQTDLFATPISMGDTSFGHSLGDTEVAISERGIGLFLTGKKEGALIAREQQADFIKEINALFEPAGFLVVNGTYPIKWATISGRDLYSVGGHALKNQRVPDSTYTIYADGETFSRVALLIAHRDHTKFSRAKARELSIDFELALKTDPSLLSNATEIVNKYKEASKVKLDSALERELAKKEAYEVNASELYANFCAKCNEIGIIAIPWGEMKLHYSPRLPYGRSEGEQDKLLQEGSALLTPKQSIFSEETLTDASKLSTEISRLTDGIKSLFAKNGIEVCPTISVERRYPSSDSEYLAEKESQHHLYPLKCREGNFRIELYFRKLPSLNALSEAKTKEISAELTHFLS